MTRVIGTILLLFVLATAVVVDAFVGVAIGKPTAFVASTTTIVASSRSSNSNDNNSNNNSGNAQQRKTSRLLGNQRPPTAQELSVMDEMIDKLLEAKPYELPNAVRRAFRVMSSPQFFLRIAARADETKSAADKARLENLATNLVTTLQAVVETTEEQLDERAEQVQKVVQAAAEPDSGEFLVPLLPERVLAMRTQLERVPAHQLDEGFLSTLDAWMNKSHQDGMDLMVNILQKCLQLYCGLQIQRALERAAEQSSTTGATATPPPSDLLKELLQADPEQWNAILVTAKRGAGADSAITNVLKEVQRTTETVVLQLDAGSMAQRVQAEYLQELTKRVEQQAQ